jgi:hypothetical protein
MSRLSNARRMDLPDTSFAVPETRKYPVTDESHARNALSRVAQHGSPEEKSAVNRAIKAKFPDLWQRHVSNAAQTMRRARDA